MIIAFYPLVFCFYVVYGSQAKATSSTNAVRFLIMGDWGCQQSANSNNNNKNRKLYNDEPDTYEFLAANRENKESGEGNGNNNNNNKQYWSVLVAQAMATYASTNPADFLIALGDNFYNNGVSSTSDSLWTTYYTNVYNYDSLQIPWYANFGNHDYGSNKGAGSTQAQIDYGTEQGDSRWHAGHCYMNSYTIPNTQLTLEIVIIDSTLIAPEETYMTSTSSGISSSYQKERQTEQLQCLEGYIQNSTASYLIVAGHYPIYSTGKNSPGDMTSMVETVYPLLEKYNVDIYLAGHDHRLEHLSYTTANGGTMDFVISGAAGKPDNQLSNGITSAATSKFAAATGGFSYADVTDTGITISMIDTTGTILYSFSRQLTRSVNTNAQVYDNEQVSRTTNAGDRSKNQASSKSNDDAVYFNFSSLTDTVVQELAEIGILVSFIAIFAVIIAAISSPRHNTVGEKHTISPSDEAAVTVDMEAGDGNPKKPRRLVPLGQWQVDSSASNKNGLPVDSSNHSRVKLSTRRGRVMQTKFIKPIKNIHANIDIQRPSSEVIADAVAETARRIERLGTTINREAQHSIGAVQLPVIHLRNTPPIVSTSTHNDDLKSVTSLQTASTNNTHNINHLSKYPSGPAPIKKTNRVRVLMDV